MPTVALGLGLGAIANGRPFQPLITSHAAPILTIGGLKFRDLNRNGKLDPYEDWRLSAEARATDLLSRLSLAEKTGLMVVPVLSGNAPFGKDASGYDQAAVDALVMQKHVSAFGAMTAMTIGDLARSANAVQATTERSRWAIPALLLTDPRHGYQKTFGASVATGGFSQWPDFTGFGAIGSPDLVREYAGIVRKDYRLVGFTVALSPQADLATEPRWPRINGTFGEDPALVGPMVAAYIEGLQGSSAGLQQDGVAAVVKHWVGYGAAKDGLDSHNYYGRFSALTTDELAMHLKPFEAAFKVHPSSVMPAYSIFNDVAVNGRRLESVGAAYSRPLLHDLLRSKYRFGGVVLSDWAIAADCGTHCSDGYAAGERPGLDSISMAWGVEKLSRPERFAKAIDAGVDQFGGEPDPGPIALAVDNHLISMQQINESVHRILVQRFSLGLFEHPFVDPDLAVREAGSASEFAAGRAAEAEAMVVLRNGFRFPDAKQVVRVFLRNVDAGAARSAGYRVVDSPEQADIAIVRISAPSQALHPNYFFGAMQHEGSLAFASSDPDIIAIKQLARKLPTLVDIYLDRPAILTPLEIGNVTLIADFGASDAALFDVLSDRTQPKGKLPFELPSSMEAVIAQDSGLPSDSRSPLYPVHYGISTGLER